MFYTYIKLIHNRRHIYLGNLWYIFTLITHLIASVQRPIGGLWFPMEAIIPFLTKISLWHLFYKDCAVSYQTNLDLLTTCCRITSIFLKHNLSWRGSVSLDINTNFPLYSFCTGYCTSTGYWYNWLQCYSDVKIRWFYNSISILVFICIPTPHDFEQRPHEANSV